MTSTSAESNAIVPDAGGDLRGLVCPMPVLRLKKLLAAAAPLSEVCVVTDDPHAPEDIRTFARQSGHEVISQSEISPGVTLSCLRRRGENRAR